MADFRFRPPPHEVRPQEKWVLRAAFLEPAEGLGAAPAADAVEAARRLGLSTRIAHRLRRDGLESRLDKATAEQFLLDHYRAATRVVLLDELCQLVAAAATELETPLFLLKGMALLRGGYSEPGGRDLGDLDVLVVQEQAPALLAALCRSELEVAGHAEADHLAPLAHARLGVVEIHTRAPGLRLGAREGITVAQLLDAGRCRPVVGLESGWVPDETLLAAHAIAHALDQHSFSPGLYPFLRLLADLSDLGAATEPRLVRSTAPYLTRRITRRELEAVDVLRRRLQAGDAEEGADDAALLLRHALVGATSEAYRRRLRGRAALRAVVRGDWPRMWRRLRPRSQLGRAR